MSGNCWGATLKYPTGRATSHEGALAGDDLHALDLESPTARRILDRIRAIPPGFVRTYGDCSPGAPRVAGAVLAVCTDPTVPWFRVVRADGSLAKGARQRALLIDV